MEESKNVKNENETTMDVEEAKVKEDTEKMEIIPCVISAAKREKCEKIIHTAAIACGGVGTGFAQLPLADSAIITPIQIAMIVNLGKEFGVEITDSMAMGIIGGLSGAIVGRCVSSVLFGWVPVVGNVVNTATAAGLTEAIGHLAMKKFEEDYSTGNKPIKASKVVIA